MATKRERGYESESGAAEFLKRQGYTIITRNYTIRGGEIDLIAFDGECLVFCEVRLRRDGTGFATLGPKKVQAMKRAAAQFRREWGDEDRDFRFDLVTFDGTEFEHFPDFVHFD